MTSEHVSGPCTVQGAHASYTPSVVDDISSVSVSVPVERIFTRESHTQHLNSLNKHTARANPLAAEGPHQFGALAAPVAATLDPVARKKVSASAESKTRPNWVLHRPTACGLHRPFTAAIVTMSRNNLVPSPPSLPNDSYKSDRSAVQWRLVFSVSPAPAPIASLDATLTSIQKCYSTPGNQEGPHP